MFGNAIAVIFSNNFLIEIYSLLKLVLCHSLIMLIIIQIHSKYVGINDELVTYNYNFIWLKLVYIYIYKNLRTNNIFWSVYITMVLLLSL